MKVLKKGNGQKGWAKEFKCTNFRNGDSGCGAKLLVEETDVKYTGSKHCYGDNYPDYFYGFVCPECGNVTDFKDSDKVPSRITSKLEKVVSPEIRNKIF